MGSELTPEVSVRVELSDTQLMLENQIIVAIGKDTMRLVLGEKDP